MENIAERVLNSISGLRGIGDIPSMLTGLSRSETAVLGCLARRGQCGETACYTGSKIARCIGLSQAGVSQLISSLERKGYVRRLHDMLDRRVVRIELTEQGQKLSDYLEGQFRELVLGILEVLGPADAAEFASLFERVSVLAENAVIKIRETGGSKPACVSGRGEEE